MKTQSEKTGAASGKRVGLFVTCPVDLFRPSVAESVVEILEAQGYEVVVPEQSCCGQVGYNNGDRKETKNIALVTMAQFKDCDYVVVPSGSCGGMLKQHYLELFKEDDSEYQALSEFSKKVFEFTSFLYEVIGVENIALRDDLKHLKVTYHDSCAGLRELNIKEQPRALLNKMANIEVSEMQDTNVCCGFGGTFCVKFSDISNKMVSDKIRNARELKPHMLLGGDVSCLLNIAGALHRKFPGDERRMQVRHVAEVLAGKLDVPGIGESEAEHRKNKL